MATRRRNRKRCSRNRKRCSRKRAHLQNLHRGGETEQEEILRKVFNGPDASDIAREKKQQAVIDRLRRATASAQLPCRRFCDAFAEDERQDLQELFPGAKASGDFADRPQGVKQNRRTTTEREKRRRYDDCALEFCDDACEMARFDKEHAPKKDAPAYDRKYSKQMIAFMKKRGASSACTQNNSWRRIMREKYRTT